MWQRWIKGRCTECWYRFPSLHSAWGAATASTVMQKPCLLIYSSRPNMLCAVRRRMRCEKNPHHDHLQNRGDVIDQTSKVISTISIYRRPLTSMLPNATSSPAGSPVYCAASKNVVDNRIANAFASRDGDDIGREGKILSLHVSDEAAPARSPPSFRKYLSTNLTNSSNLCNGAVPNVPTAAQTFKRPTASCGHVQQVVVPTPQTRNKFE